MSEFFVYSFFFGILFFFFPVFATLEAYVDPTENRAWFSLSAYNIFKVLGGYAQLNRDGIAVHLTKKKAVFLPFAKMSDTKKMFEVTQGFQLWKFHQVIETGKLTSPYSVLTASALQSISGSIFSYLQTRYPFLSLKNSVLLREDNCLKVTLKTSVVFNGLVIAIAVTKKLLEALINWIRRKKSTRFSKEQPNS